jgi:hypothetical protein
MFSMDTEQFSAPPMTTGALKAHFLAYGWSAAATDVELVHFLHVEEITEWLDGDWPSRILPRALAAIAAGETPVFAFSCYTWNVAEFLDLARLVKKTVPAAVIVAGGPHVQRAQDFLHDEAIDVIVLGEGEETFTEFLDARGALDGIAGLAFLDDGELRRTADRRRETELDRFPSALDVIDLSDAGGKPRYRRAAYETSRGCPYRCAFCEWGTGAIGTKMYQFSLERIRTDLERLVAGGIEDIWFCDSNFGALREDEDKAAILVDIKRRTDRPHTFATSWSKNHNARVQRIVRLLHRNALLWHYHLALQTLTPEALKLSHRTNMRANDYEPIVKSLAEEGVPIAAELIWGLPGDNLADFESNLEGLLRVFPRLNIFGYALLPGTEFFDRRDEYRLETIPIAGYGKAKGEYVVGCHTFSRDEGEEGYALITAYLVLCRGHMLAHTTRYLALTGRVPVAPMLRAVMRALLEEFGCDTDRMTAYERRADNYVTMLSERDRAYATIRRVVSTWLAQHEAVDLHAQVLSVVDLDYALAPRVGDPCTLLLSFDFAADEIDRLLESMDLPTVELFDSVRGVELAIDHPARVGEVLRDPDGGEWMRGRIRSAERGASAA